MKWERLVELGRELPEVEESTWYRMPSLAVCGKSFAGRKDDDAAVVFLVDSVADREILIVARPDGYYTTDHYARSAAVLARLSKLRDTEARRRLLEAWRIKAPKRLVRKLEGE
ncbi:MAG: hypothetical protein GY711_03315 [bacterium]|nr:hypothetical protein [bacterium]